VTQSHDLAGLGRLAFVVAALLLGWVHATPFHDLTSVANITASEAGNAATQVAFLAIGCAAALAVASMGPSRLMTLATPPLILLGLWLCVSIALSPLPAVSARRLVLLLIVVLTAAAILLSMRSVRQFADVTAGVSLAILLVSYAALVVVPDLSTHTALDIREPEHAGAWRGVFAHKNEAGAMSVLFLFAGLLARAQGTRILGNAVIVLSLIFLLGSGSKTALGLAPTVLLSTALIRVVSRRWARAVILLGPAFVLAFATVGGLLIPGVADAISAVLPDVSFTARTDIWKFAIDHIAEKPLSGWGYGAFWKTEAVIYGSNEANTWASEADQAHNGYLDVALVLGIPGLLLTLWAFAVEPLRDLTAAREAGQIDPLSLFFVRIWMFGLTQSSLESLFFDGTNAAFFTFLIAVFGLRYVAEHGVARDARRVTPPDGAATPLPL
jgi:O-antigen ligase